MMAIMTITTPQRMTKGAATSLWKLNIAQLNTCGSLTPPPIIRIKPATITRNPIRIHFNPLRVTAILGLSDILKNISIIKVVLWKRHKLADNKIRADNADHNSRHDHHTDHYQQRVESEDFEKLGELLTLKHFPRSWATFFFLIYLLEFLSYFYIFSVQVYKWQFEIVVWNFFYYV